MLRQSIRDPTSHTAVLRSIAAGHNRNSTIVDRTQLASSHVAKILDTLERLELVERLRPVTASPRGRKTAYAIKDQFLRFHFRFLEPARSQLRTPELAEAYLRETVLPQLDHHASLAWEEICREYVLHAVPGVTTVGRWWGQVPTGDGRRTEQREVDVVGVDGSRRPRVVGMCKWTGRPVDVDELALLDRLLPHIGGQVEEVDRYLFSRSGFTERMAALGSADDRLHLVTPADIYR